MVKELKKDNQGLKVKIPLDLQGAKITSTGITKENNIIKENLDLFNKIQCVPDILGTNARINE